MKVHYPKLYNMAHILSLNVFTASKGSNNYILFSNLAISNPPYIINASFLSVGQAILKNLNSLSMDSNQSSQSFPVNS